MSSPAPERPWGITRQQAQKWGTQFEWIKGKIVQVCYALVDCAAVQVVGAFGLPTEKTYVNYSHLRPVE